MAVRKPYGTQPASQPAAGRTRQQAAPRGRSQQTGMTGGFTPAVLPGRTPAASRLDFYRRQADAMQASGRARANADLTTAQANGDHSLESANRRYEFTQNATNAALEAAGNGVGYDQGIMGRQVRAERQSMLNDQALLDQARARRLQVAAQSVADAENDEANVNAQILVEAALLAADPTNLMTRRSRG